ncbi:putative reverse transcriptase domain-containing protein [Tanacetum coccineum]
MVTPEPMQSNMNVEVESDVGPTVGQHPTGNTPGISSYANVAGAPSRKAFNFHTLFTPGEMGLMWLFRCSLLELLVNDLLKWHMISSMDGLDAMIENGSWFIRNNPLILKKWNPDVNLLKEDVGNVSVWVKLHGVYGRSSYTRASIEVQADVELKDNIVVVMPKLVGGGDGCPKNIDSDVVKNIKKPIQTPRGVPVGPKVGFKPVKQVYRHVSKKNTVNTNGFKKKYAEPTIENVESSSTSTFPIVEKNDKMERLIIEGKVTLVDDEDKPLTKKDGYGTNSLLEQWKESYVNGEYDFDLYDDDMYEGQDILDRIQDICDNIDIKV